MTADDNHPEDANSRASDPEKLDGQPLRRSAFKALVQDFSPFWFTWCMNSGILALLLQQCPYQFNGVGILGIIFYVLDLTLFVIFSLIFIVRFLLFGKEAYNEVISQPPEMMFCACWPIAWMTLTSLTGLVDSNAHWGHHPFTLLAYVMWWICVVWSLSVTVWVFGKLIQKNQLAKQRMPTLIILAPVSASTVAVTGGLIVSKSYEMSPRLGVPVIIVSFIMLGIGVLLGFMLSTYLFYDLLIKGWPPQAQIASVFIFIGPMGQSAAGLQQLGLAARVYRQFAGYDKGTFLTEQAAVPLEAACVLIALLLTGLGIVWVIFSIFGMIEKAIKRELKWAPTWNSIIFPTGTLTTSTSLFAIEMDSAAWRVITSILIITLAITYFVNLTFTIIKISKGELLIIREDPRVKKKLEENQKGR